MSLYDGFNGLQIGSGLNALHQGIAARNGQALQGLGAALDGFVQNMQEKNKEKARKKSALDYLLRNGYSKKQAEQVTDTVGPEIVGQLMLRDWKKQDTDEARRAEFEDWLKKNDINYKQAVTQSQFGQLMQNLGLTKSKDWDNSRQGVIQYNADVKALQDFVAAHPEYANVLKVIDTNNPFGQGGYFDEDIAEKLKAVTGDVDATEAYLKELQKAGKLDYVKNSGKFVDALDLLAQESGADFNKLTPYLNLEEINGKKDTAAGREAKIDREKFQRAVAKAKKDLEEEAQKPMGQGKLPEGLTKAIVKEILKDRDARRRYRMLGGQI